MQQNAQPSMISVIVPVYNGGDALRRCLGAVMESDYPAYECVVVDDGSTDESQAVARELGAQVVPSSGGPHGPAFARNRGAEAASGEVLFFVDADVVIHRDALSRVARTLVEHPDVDAVFGSYDESPDASEFVSQYKNLFHHFVHQQGNEDGATFWSGCGAVRRQAFFGVAGFDEKRYPRPSIEDIDLGYRLRAAGSRILLNKEIQAKHLKRWTLRGMTESDVFDRAIPWTLLILRDRNLPNDLNLRLSQRMCALLLCGMLLGTAIAAFFDAVAVLVPLLASLSLLVVGYWRWRDGLPPAMSPKAAGLTYLLFATIALVALFTGNAALLLLLAPALVATLAGHHAFRGNAPWGRGFFGIVVLGFTAAVALLLLKLPVWLLALVVLSALLIVVLNYRLYAFFAQRRGVIFAIAVVPFQLLYYFYSVVALAVGTGLYAWGMNGRQWFWVPSSLRVHLASQLSR